jgi:aquaporin Z
LTTGALTGGSFNPARTLGPAVVGGIWTSHWLYWAAPISGMVIGMHLYELLRTSRPPADEGVGAPAMGTEGPLDL